MNQADEVGSYHRQRTGLNVMADRSYKGVSEYHVTKPPSIRGFCYTKQFTSAPYLPGCPVLRPQLLLRRLHLRIARGAE
jgi:hypothetical protein